MHILTDDWFERLMVSSIIGGLLLLLLLLLKFVGLDISGLAIVLVLLFVSTVTYFGLYCVKMTIEEEEKDA